jgi:hypothetical protein
MLDKLKTIWKPSGWMNTVDIGNMFFLVNIDLMEDRQRAIEESVGSYMIIILMFNLGHRILIN